MAGSLGLGLSAMMGLLGGMIVVVYGVAAAAHSTDLAIVVVIA
jgi:hypothetical protein